MYHNAINTNLVDTHTPGNNSCIDNGNNTSKAPGVLLVYYKYYSFGTNMTLPAATNHNITLISTSNTWPEMSMVN